MSPSYKLRTIVITRNLTQSSSLNIPYAVVIKRLMRQYVSIWKEPFRRLFNLNLYVAIAIRSNMLFAKKYVVLDDDDHDVRQIKDDDVVVKLLHCNTHEDSMCRSCCCKLCSFLRWQCVPKKEVNSCRLLWGT